jgi:hypothetical protein
MVAVWLACKCVVVMGFTLSMAASAANFRKVFSSLPDRFKLGYLIIVLQTRLVWLSIFAGTLGVCGLSFIQRSVLKVLLQYKGFMKLEHGQKAPTSMKLWFWLVKSVSGRNPATYNFQGVLPSLPVPPLRQTCEKYLLTVKPLLSAEEFAEMEKKAALFLKKDAWKLQVCAW